jgi:SulP family sulfate permease
LIGLIVIPVMSVAFAVSFAALVFKGQLALYLGQGISLTLLGAVILGFVGSIFFSYRGTVCGPQDVTTILIGSAALSISTALGGSETVLITVVVFIGLCSIVAGASAYLFGKLRLGYLARFVPYPVIGGFLAATGYLLTTSALGMMLGREVTMFTIFDVLLTSDVMHWVPWVFCAGLIVLLLRVGGGVLVLPAIMLGSIGTFYAALYFSGVKLDQVEKLLLGPFTDMEWTDLASVDAIYDIGWYAIFTQVPTLIAVAGLTILGILFNSTGLELTVKEDSDLEVDLRAAGLSNIIAGCFGSLPGYQLIGETLLARYFGLRGPIVGISAAVGCLLSLTFGAAVLGYIPIGAVAMLIGYLGLDLLLTWLWDERRRLSKVDFGIVLLILLVAALVGFLEALAVGLLVAMAIFVLSYARLDVVRRRSTAATRRSRVERSNADDQELSEAGSAVIILELTGYVFFGSANTLTEKVRDEVTASPVPACIILDFTQLVGFDGSAGFALHKLVSVCRNKSVRCVFSGMRPELEQQYLRSAPDDEQAELAPTLDRALVEFEISVLEHRQSNELHDEIQSVLSFAENAMARKTIPQAISWVNLEAGDVLVEEGSHCTDIFVLLAGSMRAEVSGTSSKPVVVARFLPGALIGELAYYASVPRTATLIAEGQCTLFKMEPDKLTSTDADLIGTLHALAASHIARRLIRANQLLRDTDI